MHPEKSLEVQIKGQEKDPKKLGIWHFQGIPIWKDARFRRKGAHKEIYYKNMLKYHNKYIAYFKKYIIKIYMKN